MYHFTNGCAALCVCCVWFAFASRTLEMCLEWKSYCTIVSNIHDANASFLYIFYSVGCFASSSLHDAAAFQCSILWLVRLVVVSFEYLTVFFRFVILFSWAVIIDAVQFTSYAVHTDVCSLSLSLRKVIKYPVYCDDNAYRTPLSSNSKQANERTRKKNQLPNEKKSVYIFFY